MMEQAVDVMMMSEVGEDQAGRRHKQDHLYLVTQDTKCHDSRLEVDMLW